MRIAVSTTDGKTICGHLGKCRSFIIYETDAGSITDRKMINLGGLCPGHNPSHGHAEGHGHDHGHSHSHNVDPFEGCGAVITQGMGQGMLNALADAGIKPVITSLADPEAAVMKFINGELSATAQSSCGCGSH